METGNVQPKALPTARRQAVSLSSQTLVVAEPPPPDQTLPLVLRPSMPGVNLVEWAANNRAVVDGHVHRHGAVLFRGFELEGTPEELVRLIRAATGEPLPYVEQSSPRTQVGENVYTSTDYPPEESIFLHNEQSYNLTFPGRVFFYSLVPAQSGGETPIADVRRVLSRIAPEVRARFERHGYLYVRNFRPGIGLDWQTAFQTDDRADVEAYCRANAIEHEWLSGDRLRTRQVRRVVARHPLTGEESWFNHATFFHVSTLPETMREAMLSEFSEDDLPNHVYYGDGSAIEPSVMDHLRAAYAAERVAIPWERHDLMMVDNLLAAHGRAPFEGPRRVVVGMAVPTRWEDATR